MMPGITTMNAATIGITMRETTIIMRMLREALGAPKVKGTALQMTFQLAPKGPLLRQNPIPTQTILLMKGMLQLRMTVSP